ncbi:hypothetical protein HK096_005394, partial [Nowakowskiella sp. JEL0078]
MGVINYDKWNKIELSDDEDSNNNGLPFQRGVVTVARPCKLITIPWDPQCEVARWALERHSIPFIEQSFPWGLHLWETLKFSDKNPYVQQTNVPILINDKGEVFKRSITDIFMYLFANSFSGAIRVYTPSTALTLQTYFDLNLAPAVKIIFLDVVLSSPDLTKKYLIENVHLSTHKSINKTLWPLIRVQLSKYTHSGFFRDPRKIKEAWQKVEEVFQLVEDILNNIDRITQLEILESKDSKSQHSAPHAPTARKHNDYLCGPRITAADITFAAHASLVLFASRESDSFAKYLTLDIPGLAELDPATREKVIALRESKAGQYAVRMYRKERRGGEGLRRLTSRYDRQSNPWWAENKRLTFLIYTFLSGISAVFATVYVTCRSLLLAIGLDIFILTLIVIWAWTFLSRTNPE